MSPLRLWFVLGSLCLACGSKFESAGGTDGGTAGSDTSSGGASGGAISSGGSISSGGTVSSAGSISSGGSVSHAGASGMAAGGSSTAGSNSGGAGGASAGAAGSSAGGSSNAGAANGGSAGADACAALKKDYTDAVDKARVCDVASTDECSASSTLPTIGCGCPALVNAKSPDVAIAKQKYQQYLDAKCSAGAICNIACPAYAAASCGVVMTAAGAVTECAGAAAATTN